VSISQERGWAANIERRELDKAREWAKDKRGGGGGVAACREAGGQTFGSTVHECTSRGSAAHTQTDARGVKAKSRSEVWVIRLTCEATAYADLTSDFLLLFSFPPLTLNGCNILMLTSCLLSCFP